MATLNQQDLEDILNGACIFACGGGGPYELGEKLLQDVQGAGTVDLVDPADLQPVIGVWSRIGHQVLTVSAETGQGIPRLRAQMSDSKSRA